MLNTEVATIVVNYTTMTCSMSTYYVCTTPNIFQWAAVRCWQKMQSATAATQAIIAQPQCCQIRRWPLGR